MDFPISCTVFECKGYGCISKLLNAHFYGVPDDNCVQNGVTCCFPLQILSFQNWRKNVGH